MLHILIVNVYVKPEHLEAFIAATEDNARHSRAEPGILRFDFLQNKEDPSHFTLVEVYRTPDDHPRHRETAHYARWRDAVADMMAGDRTATRYVNLSPDDDSWA